MIPAFIRPAAQRDIEAIAEYLVYESGNLTLGDRFLTALSEALILLSKFPMLGRARRTSIAELTSVRSILLKRPFSRYVIFYEVQSTAIVVVRVLHCAQDAQHKLGIGPENQ